MGHPSKVQPTFAFTHNEGDGYGHPKIIKSLYLSIRSKKYLKMIYNVYYALQVILNIFEQFKHLSQKNFMKQKRSTKKMGTTVNTKQCYTKHD